VVRIPVIAEKVHLQVYLYAGGVVKQAESTSTPLGKRVNATAISG
jgi:hypothetical protein